MCIESVADSVRPKARWADISEEENSNSSSDADCYDSVNSGRRAKKATSAALQTSKPRSGRSSRWCVKANSAWGDQCEAEKENDASAALGRGGASSWVDWGSWNKSAKEPLSRGRGRGWSKKDQIHAKVLPADDRTSCSWVDSEKCKEDLRWDKWDKASQRFSKKPQCQFIIGIEEDPQFRVGRRLLGPYGQNMKDIADKTGCRLRLRGRGSRFFEGPQQQESPDPLMLCVSSPCEDSHKEAVGMVEALLYPIYAEYPEFCQKNGWPVPDLRIRRNEGRRKGSR
jgi:hypothetical protein